jgi:hypothetical protein
MDRCRNWLPVIAVFKDRKSHYLLMDKAGAYTWLDQHQDITERLFLPFTSTSESAQKTFFLYR